MNFPQALLDFLHFYRSGVGNPEGAVTGPVGATYHRRDGGSGTTLYVKEAGTGSTGWVAVAAGGSGSLVLDRLNAALSDQAIASGSPQDFDWTTPTVYENTGSSYDFSATSINEAVPTLKLINAGTYIITAEFDADAGAADGTYQECSVGDNLSVIGQLPMEQNPPPSGIRSRQILTYAYTFSAGAAITFTFNHDATGTRNVSLQIVVQRIA